MNHGSRNTQISLYIMHIFSEVLATVLTKDGRVGWPGIHSSIERKYNF